MNQVIQPSLRDSSIVTVTTIPAMNRWAILSRPYQGFGDPPLVANSKIYTRPSSHVPRPNRERSSPHFSYTSSSAMLVN